MSGFKRVIIATAVVAACSVPPVLAQSFATAGSSPGALEPRISNTPGERASAVIRSIESGSAAQSEPVNAAAELAPLRAGGDLRPAERSAPVVVERLQIDDPARSGDKAPAVSAPSRVASGPGRAEIRWSEPSAPTRSAAVEENREGTMRTQK